MLRIAIIALVLALAINSALDIIERIGGTANVRAAAILQT